MNAINQPVVFSFLIPARPSLCFRLNKFVLATMTISEIHFYNWQLLIRRFLFIGVFSSVIAFRANFVRKILHNVYYRCYWIVEFYVISDF